MLNKKICKCLASAQVASDAAKHIYLMENDMLGANYGYSSKDTYILTAIKTCIKKRNTGFNFYVTRDEKIDSYLVYFSFKYDNDTINQISFHSYDERLSKYLSSKSLSHFEKWDGKSSRETAEFLKYYYLHVGVQPMFR